MARAARTRGLDVRTHFAATDTTCLHTVPHTPTPHATPPALTRTWAHTHTLAPPCRRTGRQTLRAPVHAAGRTLEASRTAAQQQAAETHTHTFAVLSSLCLPTCRRRKTAHARPTVPTYTAGTHVCAGYPLYAHGARRPPTWAMPAGCCWRRKTCHPCHTIHSYHRPTNTPLYHTPHAHVPRLPPHDTHATPFRAYRALPPTPTPTRLARSAHIKPRFAPLAAYAVLLR